MSDNLVNLPITINSVIVKKGDPVSGDKDIDNLMYCSFQLVEGQFDKYRFYGSGGDHIPTVPEDLTSGTDFVFIRAGMLWEVTQFLIVKDVLGLKATGHWANPRHPKVGDDDGSFQAQSGGGAEEIPSAATAYV
jgi:hypothetical protein